jgi:hypothetical protein
MTPRAADLRRLDEPGWISLEAPDTTHVETRTAQDDETRERLADELARYRAHDAPPDQRVHRAL